MGLHFERIIRSIAPYIATLLALVIFCLLAASSSTQAAPGINQQINFQGRLFNTQGAAVADGFYNIQFNIYQDGDGLTVGNTTGSPAGSLLWTESHLNANSQGVRVVNGFLSVQLGSVTPFGSSIDWNQDTLWLSMNIGNTNGSCTPFSSCSPDGEMVPMKRLSATPYSLNSGRLGGLTSDNFLQLAQGVQTDVSTNTSSIFINKTGTGNLVQLQASGDDVFVLSNSGDITLGGTSNRTLSVGEASTGVAGATLTIAAGSAQNTGTGAAGGDLILQGGDAGGSGDNNGGDITISGGAATGAGTKGLVNLSASSFITATNAGCLTNCTIDQVNVDNFGAVIVSADASDLVITLPPPSNTTTTGRIIYVTTASGSQDYTLRTNTGLNEINVAMRQNTTATMIWNGTAWTPGGASNATTLQAVYVNGTNPSTTPEIKLDSIRGTIDIQDADTSIGADILNIRASSTTGLGTVLFGVSNTGRVTIQGTTDDASAFRVLDSAGDYLFNINSSNNYVISNAVRTPGNEIANPNFESGGAITSGEEGWFGPAQANIVNDSANARDGNFSLHVNANATNIDVYAGTYYEVQPGDSLFLSGYVKNSAGANGSGGIRITWFDKDRVEISSSTDYASLPGTSYVQKVVNATAPGGAAFARVSAAVRSTATTGTYYFDTFYFKRTAKALPSPIGMPSIALQPSVSNQLVELRRSLRQTLLITSLKLATAQVPTPTPHSWCSMAPQQTQPPSPGETVACSIGLTLTHSRLLSVGLSSISVQPQSPVAATRRRLAPPFSFRWERQAPLKPETSTSPASVFSLNSKLKTDRPLRPIRAT